ncbi:helix-turn-helix domain-containing protein [Xylanimonas ulmi]|uniref:helix-turn-helix domain-containing protein n=1 Tax=Xylanimonas ulmi TaxID=228973 RepID=UPI003BF77BA4
MSKATKEEVRLRAVAAVREGHHPEDVALSLGLHRKSVYPWLAAERAGGREALIASVPRGRRRSSPRSSRRGCGRSWWGRVRGRTRAPALSVL